MYPSSQLESNDFGAQPSKNLAFASLFSIVDTQRILARTFMRTIMVAWKDGRKQYIDMFFVSPVAI